MDEPIVCGKLNKLSRTSWQHISFMVAATLLWWADTSWVCGLYNLKGLNLFEITYFGIEGDSLEYYPQNRWITILWTKYPCCLCQITWLLIVKHSLIKRPQTVWYITLFTFTLRHRVVCMPRIVQLFCQQHFVDRLVSTQLYT